MDTKLVDGKVPESGANELKQWQKDFRKPKVKTTHN